MKDLKELDAYRQKDIELGLWGTSGDSGNGCFKVFVKGKSFFVIATSEGGWDHVSVSPCSKSRKSCPTWEEMCAIKDMFFSKEEEAVEYHPKESQYVNNYEYCLHIWRPTVEKLPTPPKYFV